ncbi:hypothetical protein [Asticcacaulis sp.]|uniref:hypothetical protein n=1 Tax=Asticcacaulis sp. TaxID=1872648 RepID=UPI00262C915D|nr:hypothetical protein [Asticcacaulis sp.]
MKTRMAMAALAAALLSLAPAMQALAGDHRHGRDRHHHHHHYDRGYDRGPRYDNYRYYRPPPRPSAIFIYRDYGYGPSLVLDV